MKSFGDKLFQEVVNTQILLWEELEMTNLNHLSYKKAIESIEKIKINKITITHPVKYLSDKALIKAPVNYTKEELIGKYNYLAKNKLPINGVYRLITIIETLFNSILKNILLKFPEKIPDKRKVDVKLALNSDSLMSLKIAIVDSILNEISYKSPMKYAEEFKTYASVDLIGNSIYHQYIEIKATRDIYIHSGGFANGIYLAKAGPLARVNNGESLPLTTNYFFQSY